MDGVKGVARGLWPAWLTYPKEVTSPLCKLGMVVVSPLDQSDPTAGIGGPVGGVHVGMRISKDERQFTVGIAF